MSAVTSAIGNVTGAIGSGVGDIFGGITGATQAANAAEQAAQTQAISAQAGVDEQRRQFDAIVRMMTPYIQAGTTALDQQQGLLGLQGSEQQQAAINQLQASPFFQAQLQQGQNAMLQNASATGGLRGGNTQAAMALLAPQLLNQTYQQQLAQLSGLTHLGQASAGLQAGAGQQSASSIADLLGQQGAALAGGQIARGAVPGIVAGQVGAGLSGFLAAGGLPGIKSSLGLEF